MFSEPDRFANAGCLSFQPIHLFSQFIHVKTVRRRLRDRHLRGRRPYRDPVLTPRHRQQRLLWCRRHLTWTRRQWGDVLIYGRVQV